MAARFDVWLLDMAAPFDVWLLDMAAPFDVWLCACMCIVDPERIRHGSWRARHRRHAHRR
eukprot:157646-Chlamydomonas_euryale.AAC.1